jgi:hypothetical protein
MIKFLQHILTGADNESYSLTKLIGIAGGCSMVYQFIHAGSVDFQGLGIGVSTIMAALAAKYYVEK